ncbi:MAG: potassium channel family protein [Ornithinibacter sp.]
MSDPLPSRVPHRTGPGPSILGRGRRVWAEWRARPEDRFGVLLFFVVATIVVSSLVDTGASYGATLQVQAMSGAALLAAVRATGMGRVGRWVVVSFVALALSVLALLAIAESLADDGPWPPGQQAGPVWLVMILIVPVIVIRRLAQHRIVGSRTVLGSVAAYLQIALAYAATFSAVAAWSDTPPFGEPQPSSAYTYVSLTSISTLGVGDLVPATELARLLVSSEAIIGQVFLVTVVAIVVSSFAEARRRGGNRST